MNLHQGSQDQHFQELEVFHKQLEGKTGKYVNVKACYNLSVFICKFMSIYIAINSSCISMRINHITWIVFYKILQ